MIGNIAEDWLKADSIVFVELLTDRPDDPSVRWAGKILDVQDFGIMMRVLSVMVGNRHTAYVERDQSQVRFLPWHRVDFVMVREDEVSS